MVEGRNHRNHEMMYKLYMKVEMMYKLYMNTFIVTSECFLVHCNVLSPFSSNWASFFYFFFWLIGHFWYMGQCFRISFSSVDPNILLKMTDEVLQLLAVLNLECDDNLINFDCLQYSSNRYSESD